jgi:hypothetical protein
MLFFILSTNPTATLKLVPIYIIKQPFIHAYLHKTCVSKRIQRGLHYIHPVYRYTHTDKYAHKRQRQRQP